MIFKIKPHVFRIIFVSISVVFIAFSAWKIHAQDTVIITLSNLAIPVNERGTVEARINCEDQSCELLALTLNFNPDIIRVTGVEFGGYLGDLSRGQVLVAEQAFDNASGTVNIAAATMMGRPSLTDNLLFRLNVVGKAAGTTTFSASRLEIGDMTGVSLTAELAHGLVIVGSAPVETISPTGTIALTPSPTRTPTSIPTLVPTSQPTTGIPTNTPTNTPVPQPCTVSTFRSNVPIHVGPGANRSVRASLPPNQSIAVTGQAIATDGSLWWRIAPIGNSAETDRFWVRQSDVTTNGDCNLVGQAEASAVVGGGSGSLYRFQRTFSGNQSFNTHSFRISTRGNYSVVCNGSPIYPEFALGGTRSRGQTMITTNLSPGTHTLTVYNSTSDAAGRLRWINSYDCQVSRTR